MPGNIPKSAEGCCPSQQSSQRQCAFVHLRASNLTPFMNSQSPKAHEVSMATLGKLLKGGFHTLLKLLGHYSPSTITLIRHCCSVWQSNTRAGVRHDLLYLGERKWAILRKVTRSLLRKVKMPCISLCIQGMRYSTVFRSVGSGPRPAGINPQLYSDSLCDGRKVTWFLSPFICSSVKWKRNNNIFFTELNKAYVRKYV